MIFWIRRPDPNRHGNLLPRDFDRGVRPETLTVANMHGLPTASPYFSDIATPVTRRCGRLYRSFLPSALRAPKTGAAVSRSDDIVLK